MPKRMAAGMAEGEGEEARGKRPQFPKRKVAILLGYCGSNYQGMQLNPNAKTIERELFNALVKDALVSTENAVDPKKIAWMRACRTDKGVHAAGQVVSLKMLIKPPSLHSLPPSSNPEEMERLSLEATSVRLNSILPSDIQVFGIKRTVNSFHAKERCDSRIYEYLMPTFCLSPISPEPYMRRVEEENGGKEEEKKEKSQPNGEGQASEEEEEQSGKEELEKEESEWVSHLNEEERQLIKNYRVDKETLQKLSSMLSKFKGTHPFHNFTIGKSPVDPSSKRHILEVQMGEPFVKDDMEWISIIFHGQSFMLHQIRKMVGLVIMSIRLGCKAELIDSSFSPRKLNIPKAPSLGLLLDKGIFSGYNARFAGERDAIDFGEYEERRIKFKEALIYPRIFSEETRYNRFMGWLKCNDKYAEKFNFFVDFI